MRIKKLVIANRGEIAVRIHRAAHELGLATVQLYSEVDQGTLPVRVATERILLHGNSAKDTYLNQDKVLAACEQVGADALHPGYGFLAENAEFAARCREQGLVFVGPSPEAIRSMGDKHQARLLAKAAGVPLLPGTASNESNEVYQQFLKAQGTPLLIKATAGGSGRGMRLVERPEEFERKFEEASAEALSAFGNPSVYLEKYLPKPRHIEVQVFGDSQGTLLHLGERECSVQRRHQKVLEECPAPLLHPQVRAKMLDAALSLARAVAYEGAGTVEFLVDGGEDPQSEFYFLEMNTRIQVEHPVTELVWGVDLVKEQLRVAAGQPLSFSQEQCSPRGHALEFRVSAEDPRTQFSPATGTIRYYSRAAGPGVREDSWIDNGSTISPYYDSLIAKICVWSTDRSTACQRARAVLDTCIVEGVPTTLDFHRWLLRQSAFLDAEIDVNWIARCYDGEVLPAVSTGPLSLQEEK